MTAPLWHTKLPRRGTIDVQFPDTTATDLGTVVDTIFRTNLAPVVAELKKIADWITNHDARGNPVRAARRRLGPRRARRPRAAAP
jgi:hypothetical protein